MKKRYNKILPMMLVMFLICNLFSVSIITPCADTVDVSDCENVLAGKLPVAVYAAVANSFETNWQASILRGTGLAEYRGHTYSDVGYTDAEAYKQAAIPHLAKLTDGDEATGCRISPEDGNGTCEVIVYDLGEVMSVKAVELLCKDYAENAEVYLSVSRGTLFHAEKKIGDFTRDALVDTSDRVQAANRGARYLGIRMNYLYETGFSEIRVYREMGEAENLLRGKLPTAVYAVDPGSFETNWKASKLQGTGLGMYAGHTYSDVGYTDAAAYKQAATPHLAKLTDGTAKTKCYVSPENAAAQDEIIVYDLGCFAAVREIGIEAVSDQTGIDVYCSVLRNSLFSEENKVAEYSTPDEERKSAVGSKVRYIGLCIKGNTGTDIGEIAVYGTEYRRPDYGTDLIAGKGISRIYIAERGYPLVNTGDEFDWYSNFDPFFKKMTDGDFGSGYSLMPEQSSQNVTKDSRYIALSFDTEAMSCMELLSFTTSAAGFDVFVSGDYTDLFADLGNRVYTSGGDRRLADGSLDPAADLDPDGEYLIDLNGVTGRYLGIVITRAAAIGQTCWETVDINEVQIYGTARQVDHGENLLRGKTPISFYRANHGAYETSLGELTLTGGIGAAALTDGNTEDLETSSMFPNFNGYISYGFGAGVMIYYLGASCDINTFSIYTGFYTGLGGVDVYVAEQYNDLFRDANLMFTTNGSAAVNGEYDPKWDLGASTIKAAFHRMAKGRYVAFVFTRISDSRNPAWAYLRIREIELYGTAGAQETIPSTTVSDPSTGSIAEFEYENPDHRAAFSAKGIVSFEMTELSENEYKSNIFDAALVANGLAAKGKAFCFRFLDKNGNQVSDSVLTGENVKFTISLDNCEVTLLGEIYDGIANIVSSAQQNGSTLEIRLNRFDGRYILLGYGSTTVGIDVAENGIVCTDPAPVNPHANQTCKNFYQYLWNIGKSDRVLSGAVSYNLIGADPGASATAESDYHQMICDMFGVTPTVLGFIAQPQQMLDNNYAAVLAERYKKGVIPMLQVGPSRSHGEIMDLDETNPNRDMECYNEYYQSLVKMGDCLQALEDAGIEVYMVRMFLEMNNTVNEGFYNGTPTKCEAYKRVWRQVVRYLTEERGLTGILFINAPAGFTGSQNIYPGDDWVDLNAPTVYSNRTEGGIRVEGDNEDYGWMKDQNRPFGLSELGCRGFSSHMIVDPIGDYKETLESALYAFPETSFVGLWYTNAHSLETPGTFSLQGNYNGAYLLNHPQFITAAAADYKSATPILGTGEATLYLGDDYSDALTNLPTGNTGKSQLDAVGVSLSEVRSVHVRKGYLLAVYETDDCTGKAWMICGDQKNVKSLFKNAKSVSVSKLDNLSRGKGIWTDTGDQNVSALVDGRYTRWMTEQQNTDGRVNVTVDLGKEYLVGQVNLSHAGYYEKYIYNLRDFAIYTSTDNVTYSVVYQTFGNVYPATYDCFRPVAARYVRLEAITPNSSKSDAEKARLSLAEFTVLGTDAANNVAINPAEYANILAGKLPIAVYATAAGSFATNWMDSRLQGTGHAEYHDHTYSDGEYSPSEERKNIVAPHLAKLTDEDETSSCMISPGDHNGTSEVIVYDLGELVNVKGIEIIGAFYKQDADVYLSATRNNLFDPSNKSGSFQRDENKDMTERLQPTNKKVRYVGIYMKYVYQTGFSEIKVYASPVLSYDQSGFAGNYTRLDCGIYNVENGNAFRSLFLPKGYSITVYDGKNGTGNSLMFGESISDVSSVALKSIASFRIGTVDSYLPGDANGDSLVNINDLVAMKKCAAKLKEMTLAMDLNGDGQVTAVDLNTIRRILLGVS